MAGGHGRNPARLRARPVRTDQTAANILLLSGAFGLAFTFGQGFAIGISGWTWPAFADIFGPVDPQKGLGYGALLACAAFLMFFALGLARRGAMRGDAFVVGSITLVVASIGIFVFYPVARMLFHAAVDQAGGFSVSALFTRLLSNGYLERELRRGASKCGVLWNSLWLAVVTGVCTTFLGLAFALLAQRTPFPAKGCCEILTILPIITPPFVMASA